MNQDKHWRRRRRRSSDMNQDKHWRRRRWSSDINQDKHWRRRRSSNINQDKHWRRRSSDMKQKSENIHPDISQLHYKLSQQCS